MTNRDKIIDDLEDLVYGCDPYDANQLLSLFDEALQLYPRSIRLYNCLSELLMDHELYERALAIHEIADQIAPKDTDHLIKYGFTLTFLFERGKETKYFHDLIGIVQRLQEQEAAAMDTSEQEEFQLLKDRMKLPWYQNLLYPA